MQMTLDARLVNNSGIGVYIKNLIRQLIVQQQNLTLLHRETDADIFKSYAGRPKLKIFNPQLYSIKELLQTSFQTRHTNVFWSPHYNVPLYNMASRLKITTIHDVFHLAFSDSLSSKQRLYARLMMGRAIKQSDIIFTVSAFSKQEIIKYTGCNANKIKVVHNGIDFDKFSTEIEQQTAAATLSRLQINFPYILFVGNVKFYKNLVNALLGFKELLQQTGSRYKDLKFVIVGKKEGFIVGDDKITALLNDELLQRHVHFTGWIEDEELVTLYQHAQLFIFPSLYEGFGFPPLEAMAAGCPVISSDAACMPEVCGDAVHYFDARNTGAIARSLQDVLGDDAYRQELIVKGWKHVKKYTWENAIAAKLRHIEAAV